MLLSLTETGKMGNWENREPGIENNAVHSQPLSGGHKRIQCEKCSLNLLKDNYVKTNERWQGKTETKIERERVRERETRWMSALHTHTHTQSYVYILLLFEFNDTITLMNMDIDYSFYAAMNAPRLMIIFDYIDASFYESQWY